MRNVVIAREENHHEKRKMKKVYNPAIIVAEASDGLELRRLYRGVSDVTKRLDDQKSRSLTTADIFVPSGEALRAKLRDYCERLIFKDFNGHARKTEELLWRKGFYEAFHVAKKLRKGNTWTEMEKALLFSHLSVGVGFYHHLILKLQLEYNLSITGIIDFAYPINEKGLIYSKSKGAKVKAVSEETKRLVLRFIHRGLICIGDLSRYKLDVDPGWDSLVAIRYYKMAIAIDPSIGMPHNQLGTLAGNKNYGLDAVYHYLRCILCPDGFEGAEGNLRRVVAIHSFGGNEESPVHQCIARLLSLLQLWDSEIPDYNSVNQESEALLNTIQFCLEMEKLEPAVTKEENDNCDIETFLKKRANSEPERLTSEMIFKIVLICLMFITKLVKKESSEVQGVIAFTLALLSQILHSLVIRLQETFLEMSLSKKELCLNLNIKGEEEERIRDEGDKENETESTRSNGNIPVTNGKHAEKKLRNKQKNLLMKLRRPRRRINSSDSDASDIDAAITAESSSDELNSDISETEEDALSRGMNGLTDEEDVSDEETEVEKKKDISSENGFKTVPEVQNGDADESKRKNREKKNFVNSVAEYVTQAQMQNLDPSNIINVLGSEGTLASIKICYDWLKSNQSIVKTCAKGSKSLLKRTCVLLNLINVNVNELLKDALVENAEICSSVEKTISSALTVPLPEDVELKGMKLLEESQKNLNWAALNQRRMSLREETLLRVQKLMTFGKHLCLMQRDTGVSYDEGTRMFTVAENEVKTKENGKMMDIEHKGKLMRHMGKLWLKAEVQNLESRLRTRLMSPYLVPDHEALVKYMPSLKKLVYSKKFVIVIPAVVVSTLDELKRGSPQAREATRWLETQLKRGTRFLRAQRPHERLPLPLIKGPKPKDKESWLYFQIVECCYYLTQQTTVGLSGDAEIPVVTLLTGCGIDADKKFSFSSEGLARSAGVNVDHIQVFNTKWKSSSKSHG